MHCVFLWKAWYTIVMEQRLSTNITQRLTLNAKQQQAIRILQLSAQELRSAIEKEYLENPVLEMEDESVSEDGEILHAYRTEGLSHTEATFDAEEWKQGYDTQAPDRGGEPVAPMALSLEEELLEQASFAFREEREYEIAVFLIGSIDESGYLTVSVEEVARILKAPLPLVEKVLRGIQCFEPSGIGARSLVECLRIQAQRKGIYEGLLAAMIEQHLDEVAENRFKQIAKKENCTPEDVQLAADCLRMLHPKPGSAYGGRASGYLVPDVRIQKENGEYVVLLQDHHIPRLHISDVYRSAAREGDAETKDYIRKRLDSAAWLIRSIEQRKQTILRVVEEIVRQQREFLDKGEKYLRPMTMRDIAETLGVHESTVSRAVSNKYVELPTGIFPLRKFFTAHIAQNSSDEDASSAKVKESLRELLQAEDSRHPLSDQKLAELLKNQGMQVSRRTVMKYREQMGYASSVKRKRY